MVNVHEEFRPVPVPGYEHQYEVSNQGRVRNVRSGRVLKTLPNHGGYEIIHLSRNNISTSFRMHRLVLMAFHGPCPSGMEGCHNDGRKMHNRIENLRWDTPVANAADRVRHGTGSRPLVPKSHCPQGHRMDEENVYRRDGSAWCRTCMRARRRRQRVVQRERAART